MRHVLGNSKSQIDYIVKKDELMSIDWLDEKNFNLNDPDGFASNWYDLVKEGRNFFHRV